MHILANCLEGVTHYFRNAAPPRGNDGRIGRAEISSRASWEIQGTHVHGSKIVVDIVDYDSFELHVCIPDYDRPTPHPKRASG